MSLEKSILAVLEKKNYVLVCDLPDLVSQNFLYVQPEVDRMIAIGSLHVVGRGYSKKFDKIFKYVTSISDKKESFKQRIEKSQYTSQTNTLIKSIMEDYLLSCDIRSVSDARDMLKANPGILSKKFFALSDSRVLMIYHIVIKYGANYRSWSKKDENFEKTMIDYFEPYLYGATNG